MYFKEHSSACQGAFDEDTEITCHAVPSWTVTLNVNGGAMEETNKVQVSKGDAVGALPTPARAGYNFAGWYAAKFITKAEDKARTAFTARRSPRRAR